METTLAATKLHIPGPVQTAVARPHLIERLEGPSYRVGLVSAPAGFGKTELLSAWANGRPGSAAWLSCDYADAEPTMFWRSLLAAVGSQWPGVGDDAAVLLERAGNDNYELAVTLANDLGAVGQPIVVVIDDFHLAAPTPAVFAGLVAALPSNARLVVGSRLDPSLPLGRLRVSGSLLELHGDDLCFTPAEATAVLAANDLAVDAQQSARLYGMTEGWPAGVQLAALALQRTADRSGFLDAFASTDRAVADFLVGEVLDRQSTELVEFLLATSVLEQFDVNLCEAVAGQDDAARLLAELVAANLFVVRLNAGGGTWYRYHHLFGAFLRARLRARGHPHWRAAHERAARALEERGDIVGACHHATAAGDLEYAAAIVRRTLSRLITAVDPDVTLEAGRYWLNRYGPDLIVTDPVQVLEYLLPVVALGSADDAVWWLEQIDAAHPDAPPALQAFLQAVWGEHHQCRGEAEEAVKRNRLSTDAVVGKIPLVGALAAAPIGLARAHLLADEPAAAEAVLDRAAAQPTGHPVIDGVRVPALRAWVAYLNGELRLAARRAAGADEQARKLDLPPNDLGRIFAALTRACLHLERGEDDDAWQLFDRLRHDVDHARRPPLQALVALQRARCARILDDEATADAELTLARLMLPHARGAVRQSFGLEGIAQALRFRPSTAQDLIAALEEGPPKTLMEVKLALALGDQRRAASLLTDLPTSTTLRQRIARGVLAARADAGRDVEAANAHLALALPAAQLEGFRRTILGHGPDVFKLLMSFTPTPATGPYVADLISAAASTVAPARSVPVTSLIDPLSDRETTVLRYLSSRLTYQEISSALYISHNTLKTHVSRIFRKLAVNTRRDAVDVARQLGIA